MMKVMFAVFALCAVVSTGAQAASFDCAKAGTLVEKAICSDAALSDLDSQLGRAYKATLANSTAPEPLKAEQKSWLAKRNQCKDTACLVSAYQSRLSALGAGQPVAAAPGSVTGSYKRTDAELLVSQTGPGTISFKLEAFFKMNMGEITAQAPLKGNRAVYEVRNHEDYGDCRIEFTFTARGVELEQEGYCGMGNNVSGTGTYSRASNAAPAF